jgi:tetratricopeptide (TPR) repeat protein
MAQRVEALAAQADDVVLRLSAWSLLGLVCASMGEPVEARQWMERAIAACDQAPGRLPQALFPVEPGISMRANLAVQLQHLGLLRSAEAMADEALRRSRAWRQPQALLHAIRCRAMLAIRLGDPAGVRALAQELQALHEATGMAQAGGASMVLAGWAQGLSHDPVAGCELLLQGLRRMLGLGLTAGYAYVLGLVAELRLRSGDLDAAEAQVAEGLEVSQRLGERWRVPDLLRLRGRIAAARSRREPACQAFQQSIDEAVAQQAAWLELESRVALAELDRDAARGQAEALAQLCARLPAECEGAALLQRARGLVRSVPGA